MLSKRKKIADNKNNKKLIENFLSLSSLQIVNIILPLITLPYVLRIIGKSGYGLYAMSFTLISYFVTITDYSFSIVTPRDIAINRDNKSSLDNIYSIILSTKITMGLLALVLLAILLITIPEFRKNYESYILTIPMLIGNILFTQWLYQGLEEMKYITFINVTVKIFFTASVFLLVTKPNDCNIYIILQSSGYFLAGIISTIIVKIKYQIKFQYSGLTKQIEALKRNFWMFVNIFLPNLYSSLGIILLGIFYNTTDVGNFDSMRKVVNLGLIGTTILSQVFFPHISRNKNNFKRFSKISIGLGIIIFLGTLSITPIIFWYLNISDYKLFYVLLLQAISVFGICISNTYGQNFLVIHNKEKLYVKATAIASILGGILAIPMIYYFSIYGTAFILAFSNLLTGILCHKYYINVKVQL